MSGGAPKLPEYPFSWKLLQIIILVYLLEEVGITVVWCVVVVVGGEGGGGEE